MSRATTHGVAAAGVLLALLGAGGWFLVSRPAAAPPPPASAGEAALREAVRALQAAPGEVGLGPDEASRLLAERVRALWSARLRQAGGELAPFAEPAPPCWACRAAAGDVVLLAPAGLAGTPLPVREQLLGEAWAIARAAASQDGSQEQGAGPVRPLGVGLRAPLAFTGVAVGALDRAEPAQRKVALAVVPEALSALLGG